MPILQVRPKGDLLARLRRAPTLKIIVLMQSLMGETPKTALHRSIIKQRPLHH
ncbi:hypothetical protein [Moorena producens]|uniref:hypothetical protein n=1 Tax=Moorena producens TaxID=1155739 RepID=UPI0013140066|nr:hypothetical protein [Moorena producens]